MFVTCGKFVCDMWTSTEKVEQVTILVLVPQVRCVSIPKTINTTKNALFDFKAHGWKDSKDGVVIGELKNWKIFFPVLVIWILFINYCLPLLFHSLSLDS